MGFLNGTKVYLAGAIEYAADGSGGVVWRNEITPKLEAMGVRIYNPMRKPEWYPDIAKTDPGIYVKQVIDAVVQGGPTEDAFKAIRFIENADFRYIYDCEWVLVFMPRVFTVGTIDELRAAVNTKKPIFIVCPDLIPSSWLMGMVATSEDLHEIFFRDFDSLFNHLNAVDKGEVPLDPLKWIFLSYFHKDVPLKRVIP